MDTRDIPIAVGTPVTPYPTGVGDDGPPPRGTPLYPTVTPSPATPATNHMATPPTGYGQQTPATHYHQFPPTMPANIGGCGKVLHYSGRYLIPDWVMVRACASSITLDTREMAMDARLNPNVMVGAGCPGGWFFCGSTLTLIAAPEIAVQTQQSYDCCCCCDALTYTRSDERPAHAKAGPQPAQRSLISLSGSGCGSSVHVLVLDHEQPVPARSRLARAIGF